MHCPRCDVELKKTDLGEYGFIVLDVCHECEGAWFDKGELDRLDDSVWTNVEEVDFEEVSDSHKNLSCPKCQEDMVPLMPSDAREVVIDRCQNCNGFWLDKNELEQMRMVATKEDREVADTMVCTKRPPDVSWLKWTIQCFKDCYMKRS